LQKQINFLIFFSSYLRLTFSKRIFCHKEYNNTWVFNGFWMWQRLWC